MIIAMNGSKSDFAKVIRVAQAADFWFQVSLKNQTVWLWIKGRVTGQECCFRREFCWIYLIEILSGITLVY